jgi:hypothetical protein
MRAVNRTRVSMDSRGGHRRGGMLVSAVIVGALLLALSLPLNAAAQDTTGTEISHSLGVDLSFPDEGVIDV